MKIYHGLWDKNLKRRPRSIAIGIFDGVHRGHRRILSRGVYDAKRFHAPSMVVTFDPHPVKILKPAAAHPILMSLPHRLRFFERLGVEETLVIRFNRRFSQTTRERFLKELLIGKLGMRSLCVGHDFRFGCRGEGDAAYLSEKSRELGFHLSFVRPVKYRREIISSTRIRRLIESGRLGTAREMLGRPVSVYGTVVHGRGRGKSVGFPTANLNPHHETLPPAGVYAAWGFLNGRRLKGVIHIGEKPTFNDKEKSLEVHFLNFHKNIYGKEIELIFVARLRGIRRFKSREDLSGAIQKDAGQALRILRRKAAI